MTENIVRRRSNMVVVVVEDYKTPEQVVQLEALWMLMKQIGLDITWCGGDTNTGLIRSCPPRHVLEDVPPGHVLPPPIQCTIAECCHHHHHQSVFMFPPTFETQIEHGNADNCWLHHFSLIVFHFRTMSTLGWCTNVVESVVNQLT